MSGEIPLHQVHKKWRHQHLSCHKAPLTTPLHILTCGPHHRDCVDNLAKPDVSWQFCHTVKYPLGSTETTRTCSLTWLDQWNYICRPSAQGQGCEGRNITSGSGVEIVVVRELPEILSDYQRWWHSSPMDYHKMFEYLSNVVFIMLFAYIWVTSWLQISVRTTKFLS